MNRLMVGPDYEQLRDTLTHVEHGQNLRFETERIGEPLLILSSGFRVKRFPNCGSAHRAMDGSLDLVERARLRRRTRSRRSTSAPRSPTSTISCTRTRRPRSQAKFSLEYGARRRPADRQLHPRRFHRRGGVARPEVRALYPRIHRHPVDKAEGEFPTEVEVVLRDGRRFETAVPMPAGSLAAPFTDGQYLGQVRRLRRGPAHRGSDGGAPRRVGGFATFADNRATYGAARRPLPFLNPSARIRAQP